MHKISLYIADKKVDLDEQSLIQWNYTAEELENPTIVVNSFSQQVTLRGTENNNAIFGDLFRADRLTNYNPAYHTGIHFDCLRRTPFTIYNELSEVLVSGYCKLDQVDQDNADVSYKITLYGGLGDFFYSLMYTSTGSKKTLADLDWNGVNPRTTTINFNKDYIAARWAELANGTPGSFLNFCPAYNGYPTEDFDANKALVGAGDWENIPDSRQEGESGNYTQYGPMAGTNNTILVNMQNKHNEWEMRDLRTYLQRPCVSIAAFLDAISEPANNGGYSVNIDQHTMQSDYIEQGWITMPLISRKDLNLSNLTLCTFLNGSETPADYLISLAKTLGMVFQVNSKTKEVTITFRSDAYNFGTTIDINDRIDRASTISKTPFLLTSKWYEMKNTMYGELADKYEDTIGRVFGSFKIDTGYEFDVAVKDLQEKNVYKGALDVQESSPLYVEYTSQEEEQGHQYTAHWFGAAYSEDCKYLLYSTGGDSRDFNIAKYTLADVSMDDSHYDYLDYNCKLQLHGEEGKAQDGSNVLVFFTGMESLADSVQAPRYWHLSDDDASVLALLNDGKACWDKRRTGTNILSISQVPSFKRYSQSRGRTWDFGIASQYYNQESAPTATAGVYYKMWADYISDRFDRDTRVCTCKVDLSGMRVDQDMLLHLYWFDNCLWVLNKISNYSYTTDGLTECEFIKVKDTQHYTLGQNY